MTDGKGSLYKAQELTDVLRRGKGRRSSPEEDGFND
jgi:hypothetical protein